MKHFVVGGCLVAGLVGVTVGQTFPVRLYGGAMNERAYALVEGVDNGFCLGGWTRSFGPGVPQNSNVAVVKTDPLGNPVWAAVSVGLLDDEAYSMVRVPDGYVLCGWTRSYGFGTPNKNIFVIKLGPNGAFLWGRVYGGYGDEEALSICATHDGGFAVTGWTASYGANPMPNIFVLRLDPMGRPMWFRIYWGVPQHIEDIGHSIIETPDLGFAVVGKLKATGPGQYDPFLMKLDPMGAVQWAAIVPGEISDDVAWSVAVDQQQQILVSGYTHSFGTVPGQVSDIFSACFQLGGGLVWAWSYGWPMGDEQALADRELVATMDGGSAVTGLTRSVGPGVPNANLLLLKLDQNGQPMWCSSHPSPYWPGRNDEVGLPVVEMAGGGYAVAGYSNSWPLLGGGDDMILSTFDVFGNRPVCAEPQMPMLAEMPWIRWYLQDTLAMPELDSMPMQLVVVGYDSVCYDTSATGIRNSRESSGERLELKLWVCGSRVELELTRDASVAIRLVAIDGRVLANIAAGELGAGQHSFALPAPIPAGVSVIRAETNQAVAIAKIVRF